MRFFGYQEMLLIKMSVKEFNTPAYKKRPLFITKKRGPYLILIYKSYYFKNLCLMLIVYSVVDLSLLYSFHSEPVTENILPDKFLKRYSREKY